MRGIVEFAFYDRTRKSFRNRREVFSNRRSDGAVEKTSIRWITQLFKLTTIQDSSAGKVVSPTSYPISHESIRRTSLP